MKRKHFLFWDLRGRRSRLPRKPAESGFRGSLVARILFQIFGHLPT